MSFENGLKTMLLPARGGGVLLVVSNDPGHDKQNFTGGNHMQSHGHPLIFSGVIVYEGARIGVGPT